MEELKSWKYDTTTKSSYHRLFVNELRSLPSSSRLYFQLFARASRLANGLQYSMLFMNHVQN
jgi:hypothetical protein